MVAAIFASITYSAIRLAFDPLINPDAVLYLLVAQAWLDGGIAAATQFDTRPFYSLLIAALHWLTGLPLLISAHLLDAGLIALLTVSIQRLASILGVSVRVQLLVVLLTLLLPSLNEFRSFLIRDFGYWAFCVLAISWLIRYIRLEKPRYAIAFFGCGLAAALFRMEAVLFLSTLPLALLLRHRPRLMPVAKLYLPHLLFASAVAVLTLSDGDYGRLGHALTDALIGTPLDLLHSALVAAQGRIDAFGTYVVDGSVSDFHAAGAIGGMLTMVLAHMINACSVPLFAFATVGTFRRSFSFVDPPALRALGATVVLVVVGMFVLALAVGVVQTRYAEMVAIVVVILAGFSMHDLAYGAHSARFKRNARILVGVTFVYLVGEAGFALKHSKSHYLETVSWIQQHTPPNTWVYSNDVRIPYLGERNFRWTEVNPHTNIAISELAGLGYEYWVYHVRRDDQDLDAILSAAKQQNPELREMARISNARGDAFVVLRLLRD